MQNYTEMSIKFLNSVMIQAQTTLIAFFFLKRNNIFGG